MKAFFLNIYLLFLLQDSNAQQNLLVTYKEQYLSINEIDSNRNFIYKWMEPENQNREFKLFINNDRSLFKVTDNRKEAALKKARNYDHCEDCNSFYADKASGYLFRPTEALTNQPVIVKDKLNFIHWYFTKEEANICGFSCRKAIGILGNGYVYAWYAYDLPKEYGPFIYTGLPGTVLLLEFSEVEVRYIASSVTEEEYSIVIPDGRQILRRDYDAILQEKRSYRGGFLGKKLDPFIVPRPVSSQKN